MKTTDFLRGVLIIGVLYVVLIAITLVDAPAGAEASGRLVHRLVF